MRAQLRSLGIALALALAPTAGKAGDYAERNALGFSPDGSHFAFEEYGVEDGSGFPYANIFVIDTATDSWVAGTPIRVRLDDEGASLGAARAEALAQARPLLVDRQITVVPFVAASNPLTETSANPAAVSFQPRRRGRPNTSYHLALAEYELPEPDCPDIGFGPFKGFRLTMTAPDTSQRVLVEDRSIPRSRHCPIGYSISEVLTFTGNGPPVAVVMINVFSIGFEGPDRRFIAVATQLPE